MAVVTELYIHPLDKHLRVERLPTIHCPGCGIGICLAAILRALDRRIKEGSIDPNKVVWMAGIGCTARAVPYVNYDVGRCLHGRAVANALGAIVANPELKVIVMGGDGDIAAIGGNHLIHAAKRNADMLVVMVTNFTYAMTGGQVAPTTPQGVKTTTTPYGTPEPALSVVKLLANLNVNYIARASVTTPHYIEQFAYKALGMKGFRLLEVLSTCPERFGRSIGARDPVKMFLELKKRVKYKSRPSVEESDIDWNKEIVIGEFVERNYPSFLELIYGPRTK